MESLETVLPKNTQSSDYDNNDCEIYEVEQNKRGTGGRGYHRQDTRESHFHRKSTVYNQTIALEQPVTRVRLRGQCFSKYSTYVYNYRGRSLMKVISSNY